MIQRGDAHQGGSLHKYKSIMIAVLINAFLLHSQAPKFAMHMNSRVKNAYVCAYRIRGCKRSSNKDTGGDGKLIVYKALHSASNTTHGGDFRLQNCEDVSNAIGNDDLCPSLNKKTSYLQEDLEAQGKEKVMK